MFEFPLRFPGQYFDKETNLHYNYFRDYDSSIGRYAQSDPIGLRGGLNTYLYVRASPLRFRDRFGLQEADAFNPNQKRPPAGWPDLSQRAQKNLARQLQELTNNIFNEAEDSGDTVVVLPPPAHPNNAGPSSKPFERPLPENVYEICPLIDETWNFCIFQCPSGWQRYESRLHCPDEQCPPTWSPSLRK
jgi:RHS repeat-associated protein